MTSNHSIPNFYMHEGQQEVFLCKKRKKVVVAGRGWGKTTLIAVILKEMAREMPGAHILFVSLTFDQAKNLSLAAIKKALKLVGLKEDLHFVIGKEPKPYQKYLKPEVEPEKYENVITFFNGFTVSIMSAKKYNSGRGGTFDAAIFDEAAFFKEAFYKDIIKPSLRGKVNRFIQKDGRPSRWYRSELILTTRARNGEGRWVYNFKELQKQKPKLYKYFEFSSRQNIYNLGGEEWFEEQREVLGELVYALEIENIDLERLPDGYYHAFNEQRNTYTPTYDRDGRMTDIDTNRLISLSFDFGGWFSGAQLWQEKSGMEYCRREYFVKESGTLDQLLKHILRDNENQQFKTVHIYGDPNGHNKSLYSESSAYENIKRTFERAGWSVVIKADKSYKDLSHVDRRVLINTIFEETNTYYPKIAYNKIACANSIIAIGLTDVNTDGSKNKTKEKDRSHPQEHAPHLTDMTDYYTTPKYANQNRNRRTGKVWR
jgi:hypothetical protein